MKKKLVMLLLGAVMVTAISVKATTGSYPDRFSWSFGGYGNGTTTGCAKKTTDNTIHIHNNGPNAVNATPYKYKDAVNTKGTACNNTAKVPKGGDTYFNGAVADAKGKFVYFKVKRIANPADVTYRGTWDPDAY